jgi:hypothetical protein
MKEAELAKNGKESSEGRVCAPFGYRDGGEKISSVLTAQKQIVAV